MFVLSTIDSPCAWHQAIARPFNNKNLNAKLMCDFGVTRFIFYAVSVGLRVKGVTSNRVLPELPGTPHFDSVSILYAAMVHKPVFAPLSIKG